ncbi:MAG TPA: MFS transporter [Ruminiclostridium sp.]
MQYKFRNNHLISTLFQVKGNPRICLFTEPLWGIPYNLYIPFITLYMYALGVKDEQIGLLLTVGMILQGLSALFGGIITDKYGRRWITFVVDIFSWSIPCLIWTFSQNFWWFLVAATFNSLWLITSTSWQCLLVEDCEPKQLVNVYTWINIAGLLAVFFAPISALLVYNFSLVPTVRVLYAFSFLLMTAKFIILYIFSTETRQGEKRMEETKQQSIWSLFIGYKDIFRKMISSRQMLLILSIFIAINISSISINNFFGLYITQNLNIPDRYVALFPISRAIVMLLFSFLFQSWINRLRYRPVMLWGFIIYIASHIVLLFVEPKNSILIIGYTLLEAVAFALVIPRRDSLGALFVDKEDRARVMSLIFVIMLAVSSPFGTIIGWLSSINRQYPFILNIVIFVIMAVIISTSKAIAQYDSKEFDQ